MPELVVLDYSVRAYWLTVSLLIVLPILVGIVIGYLTSKSYSRR